MSATPSLFAGIGFQFFSNNGIPLSGGKVYSYLAGTTTPVATYVDKDGVQAHPNPIILDSAGRVPSGGEIWLRDGDAIEYKFVLKDANEVLIATYDYVPGTYNANNLNDTLDPNQGDALVGFRQSNSSGNLPGAIGRTVHQKFQELVSVKDFGAIGDGVTDDTAAIQAAINSVGTNTSGGILFPKGTYKVTSTLTSNRQYIGFFGENISSSNILYSPVAIGNPLFDLYTTVADDKVFQFQDLTLTTNVVNSGTAIKISVNATASTFQVNGSNDSLYIDNVRVLQSGLGYWTIGLHSLNNGGMHIKGFTIDNRLGPPQNDVNTKGVYLECNDIRAHPVRTFVANDLYILRFYNSIEVSTPSQSNQVESLYINNAEFVGIANAALKLTTGALSAVAWNNIHTSSTNKIIDTGDGYLNVARFTNCDFRKNPNGGPTIVGPFIILGSGIGVLFTNCYMYGDITLALDPNFILFKFTNTYLGSYMARLTFTGNVISHFYNVFSSPSTTKSVCSGNDYNYITDVVYKDSPNAFRINAFDAVISKTITTNLTASGTFTITVPTGVNFYSERYAIAFLQQSTSSGTDTLQIRYDYTTSTADDCVFIGSGNATFVGAIRFSFMALPSLNLSTRL